MKKRRYARARSSYHAVVSISPEERKRKSMPQKIRAFMGEFISRIGLSVPGNKRKGIKYPVAKTVNPVNNKPLI